MKTKTYASIFILLEIALIISLVGMYAKGRALQAYAEGKSQDTLKIEKVIENPTPEQEQIVSYINQVFGVHATDAFKLLKGNGKCGGENGSLNPLAVNDNTIWGGRGRDWGIFQINDSWQGVSSRFLKNWKVNIDIAYQIYKESGYNFHLWTGGKCQGI